MDFGTLPDEELSKLAEDRFVALDRREAADASRVERNELQESTASRISATPELPQICPKCGATMEQGFMVESLPLGGEFRALFHHFVSRWAQGVPIKSIFFGTWLPRGLLPTRTFRCANCGYLESYAREEFAAKGSTQFSLQNLLIFVTVVSIVLGLIVWAARS